MVQLAVFPLGSSVFCVMVPYCRQQRLQGGKAMLLFLPLLSPPLNWLPVTSWWWTVLPAWCLPEEEANAPCAEPSRREESAEGIFKLLVYQRLGNELGVKITQICLCVDVQLCLIAKTAVMFAQGRILADQLSYFTMQEKTSKSIF